MPINQNINESLIKSVKGLKLPFILPGKAKEPNSQALRNALEEFAKAHRGNEFGCMVFGVDNDSFIEALSQGNMLEAYGDLLETLQDKLLASIRPKVMYASLIFCDGNQNEVPIFNADSLFSVTNLLILAIGEQTEEYTEKLPKEAVKKLDEMISVIDDIIKESSGPKVAKKVHDILIKAKEEITKSYGVEAAVKTLAFIQATFRS